MKKKTEIKHRWTDRPLYTIEVEADDPNPLRTALARANLDGANLDGAYLARANLVGANLDGANLDGANLVGANLDGANLDGANLDVANLARANLDGANLVGAYLARANLARANLARANLVGANLARANLDGAYLDGANLDGANLVGAYLARAKNLPSGFVATDPPEPYVMVMAQSLEERAKKYRERHPEVPVVEQLDARILKVITDGDGRLYMGAWHEDQDAGPGCGTTHCRGGWAIHLAGKPGYELESKVGVERAAAMIYTASTGRAPHFYATDEQALQDIKECAAAQTGGAHVAT